MTGALAPSIGAQAGGHPDERPVAAGWRAAQRLVRRLLRPQAEPKINASVVVLAAVIYGALYFAIGSAFLPGHPAWATLLLWVSAHIGALVAWQLRLPRVVGMLGAGLVMENVPWGAISAFPKEWGTQIRAAALATIFLRCGFQLDFGTMKHYKGPATRLMFLPGLTEALYDGWLGVALFNMPVLLAFTMGFILKAVGPGLVVPPMFELQKAGLGADRGIPSTVVISASFDDAIAITGYSIFSSLAITGQGNVAWEIASGPLQIVFGILGGLIAGVALGCTRLFPTRYKRLAAVYFGALLLMFFLSHFGMLAGGSLGALFLGLATSFAWERGLPRLASLGPSFAFAPQVERFLAALWGWAWEPMLFVTIGASINFSTLDSGIFPRSIIIILTGACVRMLTTFLVMSGFGYSAKEKLFYAVAWTPKATVQAALSAAPLALAEKYKCGDPTSQQCIEYTRWGNDILVTGVFTILVCGTLGSLAIPLVAPRLLQPARDDAAAGEDSESTREAEVEEDMDKQLSERALKQREPSVRELFGRAARRSQASLPRTV